MAPRRAPGWMNRACPLPSGRRGISRAAATFRSTAPTMTQPHTPPARCGPMRTLLLMVGLAMGLAGPIAAAPTLALPEGGLYQPGQYLSVAVRGAGGAEVLRIEAEGALPTVVRKPADEVVAPLLVTSPTLANLRAIVNGTTVHYDGALVRTAPAEPLAGPGGSMLSEDAYRPTFGWSPGWTWRIRRNALGLGLIIMALSAAAALLRRQRVAVGILILIAGAGVAAAFALRIAYPPVHSGQGRVTVWADGHLQVDDWSFQTTRQAREAALLWRPTTWPIFFSRQHREQLEMSLITAPDGQPLAFSYRLPAGGTVAFLTRSTQASFTTPPASDGPSRPSRMADLATRIYRRPIAGSLAEVEGVDEWMGGVLIILP